MSEKKLPPFMQERLEENRLMKIREDRLGLICDSVIAALVEHSTNREEWEDVKRRVGGRIQDVPLSFMD